MLLGIVLAGGRSTRMGQDKALLIDGDRNRLEHAMEALTQVGCNQVLVSRNDGQHIADQFIDVGPLGGLHACIQQHASRYLVLPIDMPKLPISALSRLIQQPYTAFFGGSVLPCIINHQPQLRTLIETRIHHQQRSIKGLLQSLDAHELSIANPLWLDNINTPAEWHNYKNNLPEHAVQFSTEVTHGQCKC